MLKQLGIDSTVIKRVVVCLYEAEVNIVAHAWDGVINIVLDTDTVFMRLSDNGPGIADIEMAMQKGYSTASPEVREMGFGAGMGLPNISANADRFVITSEPGRGTTLEITINLNGAA